MVMTPTHPLWDDFIERLKGPKNCNFRKDYDYKWTCKGGVDKSFARALLHDMGFSQKGIDDSCKYFEAHGGYCDCEIVFNVDK